MDPEKALEAKERGNEQFRAGQWALAISEYEEVSANCCDCCDAVDVQEDMAVVVFRPFTTSNMLTPTLRSRQHGA